VSRRDARRNGDARNWVGCHLGQHRVTVLTRGIGGHRQLPAQQIAQRNEVPRGFPTNRPARLPRVARINTDIERRVGDDMREKTVLGDCERDRRCFNLPARFGAPEPQVVRASNGVPWGAPPEEAHCRFGFQSDMRTQLNRTHEFCVVDDDELRDTWKQLR
jgi:hypothetical protein